MRLVLLGLFLVFGISVRLWAQEEIVVRGKVVDERGETLPSVTVVVKGTSEGVVSDIEGNFVIRVRKRDAVIQVSFIGYKIREYSVKDILPRMKNGVIDISVQLDPESKQLEEVVVSGYRDINKRLFPGATSTISGEEVRQAAASGVDEMLQGKVAGLSIQNVSGAPGGRPKIRIRGTASITGNAEPLWVIDGVVIQDPVPIDPNQLYSGDPSTLLSSGIGGLNPNDVESITILKDATATAIYGSRAVNGVIVVTTKRGKAGKTEVDYTNNMTSSIRPRASEFDFMDSKERLDLSLELYRKDLLNDFSLSINSGALGQLLAQYTDKRITLEDFRDRLVDIQAVNTDWFGVLFRNSFSQEHNVSLSTGSEKHTLFLSLNYFDQNASVLTNDLLRYTGSARSSFQLSKWWSIELKLDASVRQAFSFDVPNLRNLGGDLVGGYVQLNNPYIAARTMNRAMYIRDNQGNLI
ncbi:MAG: TonB-dependent receptor plug domain-containing protein, partial [Cytophagales bacterium]|nr:TonB-dependent receptor plug domain-containing protein [Cytophagales bacterium]